MMVVTAIIMTPTVIMVTIVVAIVTGFPHIMPAMPIVVMIVPAVRIAECNITKIDSEACGGSWPADGARSAGQPGYDNRAFQQLLHIPSPSFPATTAASFPSRNPRARDTELKTHEGVFGANFFDGGFEATLTARPSE
jgi:hypothetical protein